MTSSVNPRWEKAHFERQFIVHPRAKFGLPVDPATGLHKELTPLRFESLQDFHANKPIPPFVITKGDGTQVESF